MTNIIKNKDYKDLQRTCEALKYQSDERLKVIDNLSMELTAREKKLANDVKVLKKQLKELVDKINAVSSRPLRVRL